MAARHTPPYGLNTEGINNLKTPSQVTIAAQSFTPKVPLDKCGTLDLMRERLRCAYNQYYGTSVDMEKMASLQARDSKACDKLRNELAEITDTLSEVLQEEGEDMVTRLEKEAVTRNWKDTSKDILRFLSTSTCPIVLAGEVSSGKSSLLNLLLGEQILPTSVLRCTSTVCELRYAEERKVELVYRDGRTFEKPFSDITSYIEQDKEHRSERFEHEVVRISLPVPLLKSGITLLDTPGVGESDEVTDVLMDYVQRHDVFGFIFVLKCDNAGGILPKFTNMLRRLSQVKDNMGHKKLDPTSVLFVANAWDSVPAMERKDVRQCIEDTLTKEPGVNGFDPQTQIFYMDSKYALESQKVGFISEQYGELLTGIQKFVDVCQQHKLQAAHTFTSALFATVLTERVVDQLADDDMSAALSLLERHELNTDDITTVEQAKFRLWELLGQRQARATRSADGLSAADIRRGVLKDILRADNEAQKAMLKSVADTQRFIHDLPRKYKEDLQKYAIKLHSIKQALQRKDDSVFLVSGETSSGKSTVLNLLLGFMDNDFFPVAHLSSTSVLCELKYGTEKKLIAHHEDGITPPVHVLLNDQPGEVISQYVQQMGSRDDPFPYSRVEIFWPLDWLPEGVCLVDTPGVSEGPKQTFMVTEAMKRAVGVIYVLDPSNAGGIDGGRLENLFDAYRQACTTGTDGLIDHRSTVLFVSNKWDAVPHTERESVKKHVEEELAKHHFQGKHTFVISAKNAMCQLKAGYLSKKCDLAMLMKEIQTVVSSGLKHKLAKHYTTTMRILNMTENVISAFNTEYTKEKMAEIKKAKQQMDALDRKLASLDSDWKRKLDDKMQTSVAKLLDHLRSDRVEDEVSTWAKADCPSGSDTKELTTNMYAAIMERINSEIIHWEENTHCFGKVCTELQSELNKKYNDVLIRVCEIEMLVYDDRLTQQRSAAGGVFGHGFTTSIGLALIGTFAVRTSSAVEAVAAVVGGGAFAAVAVIYYGYKQLSFMSLKTHIVDEMSKLSRHVLAKELASSSPVIVETLEPVKQQLQKTAGTLIRDITEQLKERHDLLEKQLRGEFKDKEHNKMNFQEFTNKRNALQKEWDHLFLIHIKV